MAIEATHWVHDVRQVVQRLADHGIREAPQSSFFSQHEHVKIQVDGLIGIGVLHKSLDDQAVNLCVFEPSDEESSGYAEVFERTMSSLEELPRFVEEWRDFRSKTAGDNHTETLASYRKLLQLTYIERQKCKSGVEDAFKFRQDGDYKRAWSAAGFDLKIDQPLAADSPAISKQRLLADLEAIAPDLLAWHLPRDEKGKLVLKRRIPLFRYDRETRKLATYCLLVAMPEKRIGRLEIRAEWLQSDLQTARFDTVPEYFDLRAVPKFTSEIIGIEKQKVCSLWQRRDISQSTAVQVMRLQLSGQFEDAASLAGLQLDDTVLGCLQGQRVAHMCTCCAPLDEQLVRWCEVLKATLLAMNLPRIAALAERDETQTRNKRRTEPIPIIPFPLQRHTRKAHIALDIRKSQKPRLTIDTTGSGSRLPVPIWRRPLDIDILREGLIVPEGLPVSVASQLGIRMTKTGG